MIFVAFFGSEHAEAAMGRDNKGTFNDGGRAFFIQNRDECFAYPQFHNNAGDIELRVGAEGLGSSLYRLLVPWREGPERMLHPVAELTQVQYRAGRVDSA